MKVVPGRLGGVLVLHPEPRPDERGFFVRTLDAAALRGEGVDPAAFVQESQSRSSFGVLRGLHLRAGRGEAKLVRCARGAVYDVVADLRPWSPTFGQWESFLLDDVAHLHVYVPRGFAHGFQVLSEMADVCYHHDEVYDAAAEAQVVWDDSDLAVDWPHPPRELSARDRSAPGLAVVREHLEQWFPAPEENP